VFGSFPSLPSKVHFHEPRLYLFLLAQEMSFSFQRFFFFPYPPPPAPLELIKGRKRVFIPPGQRDAALGGREGASRPLAPASQSAACGEPAAVSRSLSRLPRSRPACWTPLLSGGASPQTRAASEPRPARVSLPGGPPAGCQGWGRPD